MTIKGKGYLREHFVTKLKQFHHDALNKGLTGEDVRKLFLGMEVSQLDKYGKTSKREQTRGERLLHSCSVIALVIGTAVSLFVRTNDIANIEDAKRVLFHGSRCALVNNGFVMEAARPLVPCEMCRTLTAVPVEREIPTEKFAADYAYSSVPVLIKDATRSWTAMSTFSFRYFQQLYTGVSGALEAVEEDCQFFPYNTDFETLGDALNMSDARANFETDEPPWYIGWSNCDVQVERKLREHYERPYFLPRQSEDSDLDWIFMGGSGEGALIHLDYVQKPSWQAQISGRKTWTLVPVPECEAACHTMNVTVHKGDIFVINTNEWYHSTYIHPGEISITIGSEYD